MNFAPFDARNATPDGNLKKQAPSETSSNLNCDAHVAGTSHGIFHRKRTSPHRPRTGTTCCRENCLTFRAQYDIL